MLYELIDLKKPNYYIYSLERLPHHKDVLRNMQKQKMMDMKYYYYSIILFSRKQFNKMPFNKTKQDS